MAQPKPQRRSLRLKGFDYSSSGAYFVTVCSQDRRPIFGSIFEGGIRVTDAGRIVEEEWLRTPDVREGVELGSHILMPNHLHGILWLPDAKTDKIETGDLRTPSRTIGAIVRGFKGASTKRIWKLEGREFVIFQRNYFEHVIRNEDALRQIDAYIVGNVELWKADRFYVETK